MKRLGFHTPQQECAPSDLSPPTRLQLTKVPSPPNSTTLVSKPLPNGPLGDA
jgi:hypothetical protein